MKSSVFCDASFSRSSVDRSERSWSLRSSATPGHRRPPRIGRVVWSEWTRSSTITACRQRSRAAPYVSSPMVLAVFALEHAPAKSIETHAALRPDVPACSRSWPWSCWRACLAVVEPLEDVVEPLEDVLVSSRTPRRRARRDGGSGDDGLGRHVIPSVIRRNGCRRVRSRQERGPRAQARSRLTRSARRALRLATSAGQCAREASTWPGSSSRCSTGSTLGKRTPDGRYQSNGSPWGAPSGSGASGSAGPRVGRARPRDPGPLRPGTAAPAVRCADGSTTPP